MKIVVDQDLCIGCQTCVGLCPEAFRVNDQGKSEPTTQEEQPCTKQAAINCPVAAISIEKDASLEDETATEE